MKTIAGKYVYNLLIGTDQFVNCMWGGDPDETVSSRLGRIKVAHGGKIPRWRVFPRMVAWACDRVQKDHCEAAIEHDEGKNGIFDKP
jgi:hypothetical protein